MNPPFAHLHVHSDYSLLESTCTIPALTQQAAALQFFRACSDAGVHPIIGQEFFLTDTDAEKLEGTRMSTHPVIVLLAEDGKGYANLMQLSSLGQLRRREDEPPCIGLDDLEVYQGGLILLSGGPQGPFGRLLRSGGAEDAEHLVRRFREVFEAGRFFLELQDHGLQMERRLNRLLLSIASRSGIPVVATNDVRYLAREDAFAHAVFGCIGSGRRLSEAERRRIRPEWYLKDGWEMGQVFSDIPEALSNTLLIAERCTFNLALPGPMLPEVPIPPEFPSAGAFLRHLTQCGLMSRYGQITDAIRTRADKELRAITSMGYAGYFLIMWDLVRFAREKGIPVGPGRGNSASSIVAYALRITGIDPLRYNLLFELFLNPQRISMPQISIDLCQKRRGEAIEYVKRRYGADRVGQIISFETLNTHEAIREFARVLAPPCADADAISALVPTDPAVPMGSSFASEPQLRELRNRGGAYREVIETARKLEGLVWKQSVLPDSIVIGRKPLTQLVPLYRDSQTGSIATQFTMEQLEECGLVKMDFRGLRILTIIEETQNLIRQRIPTFNIETVREDDGASFELLGKGRSTMAHLFESPGMEAILRRAKPTCIGDLSVLLALYRPETMTLLDQYIEAKSGRKMISYPFPELEPVLNETYGLIVYQDQVMEIVRIITGCSLGEADILRRTMGRKNTERMARERFVAGAVARGYSWKEVEHVFELLMPIAGKGFTRSHAVACSILAYRTAYLRANYPGEFAL